MSNRVCFYILMVANIGFWSCGKEWFDVKSDVKVAVPETLDELQLLLDDGYTMNSYSPMSGENASDFHYYRESNANRLAGYERNSYIWTKEAPNVNVPDWLAINVGCYKRVYVCNLTLEALEKIKPNNQIDELKWSNIRGQALFHRSKAFFELSQVYSPPFFSDLLNEPYGIPLKLESDINVKAERSTIKETYDRIISDLKLSISLLPKQQPYKTRPNYISAKAQLARVYLSMELYSDAKLYADEALKEFDKLLDYNTLDISSNENQFVPYNDETLFYSYTFGGIYFQPSVILIKNELYKKYENEDLRKYLFFNYDVASQTVQYKGTYSGVGYGTFFSGLATDELYLIRSECLVREGKVDEALRDLNRLLKFRYMRPYVDIVSTNVEEVLRIILNERTKELVFRGVRWSDLRRLNRDPRFAQTFTRTVNGKTYTLEPNSYKYTFPIPDDIIQITGMQQNPGW